MKNDEKTMKASELYVKSNLFEFKIVFRRVKSIQKSYKLLKIHLNDTF